MARTSNTGELHGCRFGVVVSRFNEPVTARLLDGALAAFKHRGVEPAHLSVIHVPGAWEIPVVAQALAVSGQVNAVVCLGAVVQGETPHFDYVAGECARGMARVALDTGVPIINGVLTTDTLAQADARSCAVDGGMTGAAVHNAQGKRVVVNKGWDAALVACEMVTVLRAAVGRHARGRKPRSARLKRKR